MNIDFPCICGHLRKDHKYNKAEDRLACDAKIAMQADLPELLKYIWEDSCTDFIPDNLRYLESLVEQRIK